MEEGKIRRGARAFLGPILVSCTVLVGALGSAALQPGVAGAATNIVTSCNNSGPGSLRQAAADASSGDTISFDVPATCSAIKLTTGPILVVTNLTIDGPGARNLAVSGGNAGSVFLVDATATIEGLTIEDGSSDGACAECTNGLFNGGGTDGGGGIYNDVGSDLAVIDCAIVDSRGNYGGGLRNDGTLTVTDSTISGNTANDQGGGLFTDGSGTFVGNSTIADNTAKGRGGAVTNFTESLTIANSTIYGNVAPNASGGGLGGGFGTAMIGSSILADNQGGDCQPPYTTVADLGYNLSDDGTCELGSTSLSNTPADLDPSGLQQNGGPTRLHCP